MNCTVEGCDNHVFARKMCSKHYSRDYRKRNAFQCKLTQIKHMDKRDAMEAQKKEAANVPESV